MTPEVRALLYDEVYAHEKVQGSANMTGVATNVLLAMLIVEMRKMNKVMGVPE